MKQQSTMVVIRPEFSQQVIVCMSLETEYDRAMELMLILWTTLTGCRQASSGEDVLVCLGTTETFKS